jgi:nucleoside-diphosphate-sugar epimerase
VTEAATTRLVVLGADGFIGHAVVRAALARGAVVTALCLGDAWRLAGVEGASRVDVGDRWWTRSFCDELRELLEGAAALVLLAYQPPPANVTVAESAEHEAAVNMAGMRVACAAATAQGARVVFASSADVYGRWREEAVDEFAPTRPETPYAAAKLEAEAAVAHTPHSTSLRIATVYGPGETGHRAIPRFLAALLRGNELTIHGDGSDVRDYVALSDVAYAVVAAALAESPPRVVNVGSGIGRTTNEIAAAVAEALHVTPVIRHEPSPRTPSRLVLDVGLARRSLGLEPHTDLVSGIRAEAAWLREHLGRVIEPDSAISRSEHRP